MATSMVTGGTSGIGREFVTQLASRGDDIVIVARDTTRMAQIKEQIEARYGVSVETIQADLSNRHDVASVAEPVELLAELEDERFFGSEVVRDLWRRDRGKGLSAGEKRMLTKARQILTSELALAKKIDEEEAEKRLDDILSAA